MKNKWANGCITNNSEYAVWSTMKQRCYNPKSDGYYGYGGKGITVCGRWKNSFINFLQDMGKIPTSQHSIDRIDNKGNYEPGNCRWATKEEQSFNRCNTLKVITEDNEIISSTKASKKYNLSPSAVYYRVTNNKDLTTPSNRGPDVIYKYNSKDYCLADLKQFAVVPLNTVSHRVRDGWTVEDTVNTSIHKTNKHLYNGKYFTIQDISLRTGIEDRIIRKHMKKGLTAEESVNYINNGIVPNDKNILSKNLHFYKGKKYTLAELSKLSSVPSIIISGRISEGMDIETALILPVKEIPKYLYKGEYYRLKDLSKITNLSQGILIKYIRQYGCVDNIVELFNANQPKLIDYKGEKMSLTKISRVSNAERNSLVRQLNKGLNLEDAIQAVHKLKRVK